MSDFRKMLNEKRWSSDVDSPMDYLRGEGFDRMVEIVRGRKTEVMMNSKMREWKATPHMDKPKWYQPIRIIRFYLSIRKFKKRLSFANFVDVQNWFRASGLEFVGDRLKTQEEYQGF